MAKAESIGIKRVESVHWYVRDLARARRFYTELLDFEELGESTEELAARARQRSVVFRAGEVMLLCSEPAGQGGRAWRWLQKQPEGVGTINFEVADIRRTFDLLERRGATVIDDDVTTVSDDGGGRLSFFSITTPFGNTTFRFFQRDGYRPIYPGFRWHPVPRGGSNRYGFARIDHITSNFRTLRPMALWMEHVMGFEEFWNIRFHTEEDIAQGDVHGTGLKSVVLWDPESGIKLANNEPSRPSFKRSQINVFVEENRGEGIQHLALEVSDIVSSVAGLRKNAGLEFLSTPAAYYDDLPERLRRCGVGEIDEDLRDVRALGLLVDGHKPRQYLLQIFMKEAAQLFHDREAGPFFYEIIQRKGDKGFGGGNFKALFESIERAQR